MNKRRRKRHGGKTTGQQVAEDGSALTDPQVAPYIPATQSYGGDTLVSMLAEHEMVVIKPIIGTGGNGVIRIQKDGTGYLVTHKRRTVHVDTLNSLLYVLSRMRLRRRYMIQQGIHLARIQGRPLDYRVKVVRIEGDGNSGPCLGGSRARAL